MVFSKEKALSLPPHHPYDCAINLLSGATLPSSPLYNLSRPEREAMEEYIQESLAAGIIQLSTSLVVFQALVHDVLKRILLTPWLQRHNPHIDWTGKKNHQLEPVLLGELFEVSHSHCNSRSSSTPVTSTRPSLQSIMIYRKCSIKTRLALYRLTDHTIAPLTYFRKPRCPLVDCITCPVLRENLWRTTSRSRWQQE